MNIVPSTKSLIAWTWCTACAHRELRVLHSGVGSGVEKGEVGISPQGERGISWREALHLCAV